MANFLAQSKYVFYSITIIPLESLYKDCLCGRKHVTSKTTCRCFPQTLQCSYPTAVSNQGFKHAALPPGWRSQQFYQGLLKAQLGAHQRLSPGFVFWGHHPTFEAFRFCQQLAGHRAANNLGQSSFFIHSLLFKYRYISASMDLHAASN